jgi:hydroxymethylbilane synthase
VSRKILIATRGSALALAQSNMVLARCRSLFPELEFELKNIRTTGDKLQTATLEAARQSNLEKGLFTKELEVAMLTREADFAVHSLKDLPTDLPEGLHLAAVSPREDVRDVLIYRNAAIAGAARGYTAGSGLRDFASGATIATSSTRRQAQIQAIRPDLKTIPVRGNVGTRLQKLRDNPEFDGMILALAGLKRLGYIIGPDGQIHGRDVPPGLLASILPVDEMLPCVGQAALGFESRSGDELTDQICAGLNDSATYACVTAERSFLRAMGGGCLSPVAALGTIEGKELRLRAVSFRDGKVRRTEQRGSVSAANDIGIAAAKAVL